MKTFSSYCRLLMVVALTTSSGLATIQTANANPAEPNHSSVPVETGASLLGESQIQRTDIANTPTRELPTFQVDAKPQRSRGILSVLGGRFVDEDRHPSFRKSTLPRK